MENKTLNNTNIKEAKKAVGDIEVFGDGMHGSLFVRLLLKSKDG